MSNSRHLFGTNGIRGLANEELTPSKAVQVAYAIGTFFKRGNLILGYDARTSGPMLTEAITAGLISTGCNVFLAKLAPTPALQYAVREHKLDGGVIVTASHNPPEYNGIKVIWNDGIEISHEREIEIENIFFDDKPRLANWKNLGSLNSLQGIIDEYINAIEKHVDVQQIAGKQYHIIIDCANSVGSLAGPKLARELGCKVTTLNANIDGTFPGRPPEPRPENLGVLSTTVKTVGADLGVAYDGDADRSIFVDDKGVVIMGDQTFALIAKQFLEKNPGEKIVTPISSSTIINDVADKYHGKIIWTKIGSVTVAHTIKEIKARLGGEENGGVFYTAHQPVRDGAMTTALVLEIMAKTGKKLSTLINELPVYFIEKAKLECKEDLKQPVLQKLIVQTKRLKTNTLDGLKIWFENKSSILIRPSGTEPVYRLYAEAETKRESRKLVKDYTTELKRIIRQLS